MAKKHDRLCRASGRVRLAVVGCGGVAFGQHLPNAVCSRQVELHACCDARPEALARAARQFHPRRTYGDLAALLADEQVEGVVLATRHTDRYELIAQCLAAGKPVLVEKPLAMTVAEARRIARLVRRTGGLLGVNYNRRCAPAALFAREVALRHRRNPRSPAWRFMRAGAIEDDLPRRELLLYRVNDDRASFQPGYLTAAGGGMVRAEACHFLDFAYWFLDQQPTRVTALGDQQGTLSATLEFAGRAMAVIATTAEGTVGYPKELIEYFGAGAGIVNHHFVEVDVAGVPGSEGRHRFPLPSEPFYRETPEARVPPRSFIEGAEGLAGFLDLSRKAQRWAEARGRSLDGVYFPDKGHMAMLEAFAAACRGQGPMPADVTAGYRATLLVEKVVAALEQRRPQTIRAGEWDINQ